MKKELTRGSINGYLKKMKKLSLIKSSPNPENRKEKIIQITYLGIAYFLHELYLRR